MGARKRTRKEVNDHAIESDCTKQYKKTMTAIQEEIEALQVRLTAHVESQKQFPNDWGYVGEMAYRLTQLRQINGKGV